MTALPPHIARPSRELVGPIVRFRGQPVAVPSSPPQNTCDPRYDACTDHHLACDCREAELREDIAEYRMSRVELRGQLATALGDHPTLVIVNGEHRPDLSCHCAGCSFARAVDLVPYKNFRYIEKSRSRS